MCTIPRNQSSRQARAYRLGASCLRPVHMCTYNAIDTCVCASKDCIAMDARVGVVGCLGVGRTCAPRGHHSISGTHRPELI